MTALLVGWSLIAAGFTCYALVALGRRGAPPAAVGPPAVLLLRPADALTDREQATLALPVGYPGLLEQIVVSPAPPRLPPDGRWLASDPATPNRKVGHLLHAVDTLGAGDRIVVAIDADVRVEAPLVAALAAAVASGAAVATAAPAPEPAPGLVPAAVRALLCHTHLSFAALDAVSVGAKSICGKATALSSVALEGLRELRDHVGEDLELARWLHRRGHRVVLVAERAPVPQAPGAPLGPALGRFTRWMQVLHAHRPALWCTVPVLFTCSLPLLLIGLGRGGAALGGAVIVWLARTLLAVRLEPRDAWRWPLGEALLLVAFVRSLGLRTMTWRGRRFRLARGGRMQPVGS